MKTMKCITTVVMITLFFHAKAQDPFMLSPNGTTQEFFKYVTKDYNAGGTIYHTGLLNLSGFKKITSGTTGIFYNTQAPVQKLQLTGGNILLCRSIDSPTYPDINPTSRNGAVLFGDNIQTGYGFVNGKWGIEYDDQFSSGGLNFFKPVSTLTSSRINFNLFMSNSGNIGIGTGEPLAKLQVADGDIFIQDINKGIIMKSPDGSCWRGTMNNTGQLEFVKLSDCENLTTKINEGIENNSIKVNPNPSKEYFEVKCSATDCQKYNTISIYGTNGNLVFSQPFNSETTRISTSNFKTGSYILKLHGGQESFTDIVVISH